MPRKKKTEITPAGQAGERTSPTVQAVAVIVNSKAGLKLAEALKGIVELPQSIMGFIERRPERITQIGRARAKVKVLAAKAQAESDRIYAETADYVLDREIRRTINRRMIVAE